GRLADGVSPETAVAELDRLATTWSADFPASDAGWTYDAPSLRDDLVGELRPALRVLLGVVACVLLIACANVAHLLLAVGAGRRREMAVRGALGASRGRLAAQCLTESVLLGGLGGLLGVGLAILGVRVLVAAAPPDLPRLDEVAVDGTFLAVALGVALLSSLLFGLAPIWQATRTDLRSALVEGGRTAGPASHRLRGGLVVAEVALAMALLVGAGLLVRSFDRLLDLDPGFRTADVVTFNLQLPPRVYGDWQAVNGFYDRLLETLEGTPGVRSAALAGFLPLEPGWRVEFVPEGRVAADGEEPEAQYRPVSPEWFETMGVALEAGRVFDDRDRADRPGVVVINRSAANRYWPDEDPIGRRLTGQARSFGPLGQVLTESLEVEVVGVVGDVANVSFGGPVEPALYFPHRQLAYRSMHVVALGAGDADGSMAAVKDAVWRLDPRLPLDRLRPLDVDLSAAVADRRFVLQLVGGFAALALILVAIGIYGVVSYLAGQRRREMGIRLALGAGRASVSRLVVGQGMALVGAGVAMGLIAAWALRQTLASLIYGIGTADPIALVGAATVALVAGLLASWLPARRAGRVDPVEVLQSE
ncbi:MAG: ADOP family duplicated permease, partial [Acidobacteriota bacterium]